jgi:hypothetical protein
MQRVHDGCVPGEEGFPRGAVSSLASRQDPLEGLEL